MQFYFLIKKRSSGPFNRASKPRVIDKYANIRILQGMYRVRLSLYNSSVCTPDQDRTIPQDIELPHINTLEALYKLGILMR
jgi:hypothetical protein